MLQFIDNFVIPFLDSLYGSVGYLGVSIAMAIESAMIPLPSELILPYAGFLVSDPTKLEPLTHGPWGFWTVVIVATLGNTIGSVIGYYIGAWGGRPFLERWGKYLLIRPHEIELADHFFQKYGAATAFFSRLLPVVRTFISFPAGVARMNLAKFILYSTAGAFLWSTALVWAGVQLGSRWTDIRHALQPFDLLIAVLVVALIVLFIWWRLGMPGGRVVPTRDEAWALLCEWTQSDALRKHGRAVEGAVGWYAQNHFRVPAAELETWRSAGLLHDFDYERFPEQHPLAGVEELRTRGYPDELIQAVMGHDDHTGVPRTTDLAHCVYACDEMSGFVIAVALVRPNRSLDEVDVRSVQKKMKDKGFARPVPRDQLTKGADELGIPFEQHVANVIEGLKAVRGDLGL